MRPSIALLSLALILDGCAPSLEPSLRRRGAAELHPGVDRRLRVAFVVPENRNRLRSPGDAEQMDDAPETLRDALARSAAEQGCEIVSTRSVDSMVSREFPGGRDLTDGQAFRVATELGADRVVFGRLDAWKRGHVYGRSTTVAFRLDAVDGKGDPIARVRHHGTAAQEDPADLADVLCAQAVDSLVASFGGCVPSGR